MIRITNKKQRGNEMKTYNATFTNKDGSTATQSNEAEMSYNDFLQFIVESAESGCVFQSASITWNEYDSEIVKRGESIDITCKVQADVVEMNRKDK